MAVATALREGNIDWVYDDVERAWSKFRKYIPTN